MNVGSLFSGIGGLDLGLARAGFRHAFFCESDPWRRTVLAHHFPGVPIYEDVGDVGRRGRDDIADAVGGTEPSGLRSVGASSSVGQEGRRKERADGSDRADLIAGGFPCQDVSVAGRRAGLAGERSGLFYEFARIAESLRPRFILVENVPGLLSSNGGRDFGAVLGTLADIGYGVAWRILDSRYFGVPQRRRRVFILGALAVGDPRGAAERAGEILAVGTRCERHPAAGTEAGQEVALPLESRTNNGRGGGTRYDLDNDTYVVNPVPGLCRDFHNPPTSECPFCWELMYPKGEHSIESDMDEDCACKAADEDVPHFFTTQPDDRRGGQGAISVQEIDTAPALDTTADARKSERGVRVVDTTGVRRLTPRECERLQALPDGWTDFGPDSRRYAALGDAVTACCFGMARTPHLGGRRMTPTLDGWLLFVVMLALVATIYAAPAAELKWAALAGLGILSLVTLSAGGVRSKQASAGRSSGEAVQTRKGKVI